MEKTIRNICLVLAGLPLLFIVTTWVLYLQWKNGVTLEDGMLSFVVKLASILANLLPVAFFGFFILSAFSYFLWRRQLSEKHFYLQSLLYIPYLLVVLLLRFPEQNPVSWYLEWFR